MAGKRGQIGPAAERAPLTGSRDEKGGKARYEKSLKQTKGSYGHNPDKIICLGEHIWNCKNVQGGVGERYRQMINTEIRSREINYYSGYIWKILRH